MCCTQILCTIPLFIYRRFWCGRQGISIVGTWGVVFCIPQGDVHKILIYHKQQIFSYRIEEAVSLKSLPLKIGPDIYPVCPTSNFFNNIMMSRAAWAPLDDPVASKEAELSCCVPGFVLVDYFGIHSLPKYIIKPTGTDLRFDEIWGSITSTMLCSTMDLVLYCILTVE